MVSVDEHRPMGQMSLLFFTCLPQGRTRCFHVYTYYDVGTSPCPANAACRMVGETCGDLFCCRDAPNDPSDPCYQSCVNSESDMVFHPVRGTIETVCNVQLRDRVCGVVQDGCVCVRVFVHVTSLVCCAAVQLPF